MVLHGSRVSADLKPFHENLEKRFKEMKVKTAPFKKVSTGEKKKICCTSVFNFYPRLAILQC